MNCAEARKQISENALSGGRAEHPLAGHLRVCGDCCAEWETHADLSLHFAALRGAAAERRRPLERRAELMRAFAVQHTPRRKASRPFTQWALAAAAVVLFLTGVSNRVWERWAAPQRTEISSLEMPVDTDVQEGFIAVPYAPALASGEVLRVVRTELYPAALASLGVDLDPSLTGKMPADLLVGEDGYPRAVRVSSETETDF